MSAAGFDRATALLEQLQVDLEAIAASDPDTSARGRAITRYTTTFAALGRVKVEREW